MICEFCGQPMYEIAGPWEDHIVDFDEDRGTNVVHVYEHRTMGCDPCSVADATITYLGTKPQ